MRLQVATREGVVTALLDLNQRYQGGLIDMYRMEDAEIVVVAMGSVLGTIKDAVDELRDAVTGAGGM